MKALKNEITRLTDQLFRNTQYLRHYQSQLALIYSHTPETITHTQSWIDGLKM